MWFWRLITTVVVICVGAAALAAEGGAISKQVNGTISVGNTFQVLLPWNNNRIGATIYNTSATDSEYLFAAGKDADCTRATIAAAIPVKAGQAAYAMASSGVPMTDTICITGPQNTDTFVVVSQ